MRRLHPVAARVALLALPIALLYVAGAPPALWAQGPGEPMPLRTPKKPSMSKLCNDDNQLGRWRVYWNGVTNTVDGTATHYFVGGSKGTHPFGLLTSGSTNSTQVNLTPEGDTWTVQVKACPSNAQTFWCSDWSEAISIAPYDPKTDAACNPGSCSAVGASAVVAVGGEGGFEVADGCPYELTYAESPKTGGRFLMEEWSVLSYGSAAGGQIGEVILENASSDHFARAKASCLMAGTLGLAPELLESTAKAASGERPALVVIDHTPHPENERFMPEPWVSMQPTALPQAKDGSAVVRPLAAHAVVRVEVDASEAVGRLDLVHADGELPQSVLDRVKQGIEIDYVDDRRHRMVLFVLLSIDASGIELEDTLVTLPKCCGPPCPPWPYHCP